MRELRALTGFRFIAAGYVFIFHLYERGFLPPLPWFIKNIVDEGALGVNAFFVLSGFLLTYSHLKDFSTETSKSIKYITFFLLKRIARIYPVLLVGLMANTLLTLIFNNQPANFKSLFLLSATLINAWFPSKTLAWYGGSWSVSAEMFFYIIFIIILPRIINVIKSVKALSIALIILIFLATLPGIYYNLLAKNNAFDLTLYSWFYVFPPIRLPEFISGCIAAILVFRNGWRAPAWIATTATAFGVLYLVKFGPSVLGHVEHNRVILPVILIVVAHLAQPKVGLIFHWLTSKIVVYLGRISYGFYIWQIVALEIPGQIWFQYFGVNNHYLSSFLIFFSILFAAIISYHFVEKPCHGRIIKMLYSSSISDKTKLDKKLYSSK